MSSADQGWEVVVYLEQLAGILDSDVTGLRQQRQQEVRENMGQELQSFCCTTGIGLQAQKLGYKSLMNKETWVIRL